jgi:hypothetical protein
MEALLHIGEEVEKERQRDKERGRQGKEEHISCPFHKMMTFTPSLHRGGFCFFARRSFAL